MKPENTIQLLILSLSLFLASCAAQGTRLSYSCNPAGASAYDKTGKFLGKLPLSEYKIATPEDLERKYMRIKTPTVKWVSGAKRYGKWVKVPLSDYGYGKHSMHYDRPSSSSNLQADLMAADAYHREQERERQLAAIQEQKRQEFYSALGEAIGGYSAARKSRSSLGKPGAGGVYNPYRALATSPSTSSSYQLFQPNTIDNRIRSIIEDEVKDAMNDRSDEKIFNGDLSD